MDCNGVWSLSEVSADCSDLGREPDLSHYKDPSSKVVSTLGCLVVTNYKQ